MAKFVKLHDQDGAEFWLNMDKIEAMYREPEFEGSPDLMFEYEPHPARTLLAKGFEDGDPYYALETPEDIAAMLK